MFNKAVTNLLTAVTFAFSASVSFADTYATVIFDVSGSMQGVRVADGLTRCEYGKQLFLETIGTGISHADYLNVVTFDVPGSITSLSNGFIDVQGLTFTSGPGLQLFNDLATQIESLSCNGSSTALGDTLCDTMDSLRNEATTSDTLRMAFVTDAGENNSQYCGGSTYVEDYILPKVFEQPRVIFDVTVLTEPGNVGAVRAYTSGTEEVLEEKAPKTRSGARGVREEIQDLILISKFSGGEAAVVADNEVCISGCAPMDGEEAVVGDDPWGGAW